MLSRHKIKGSSIKVLLIVVLGGLPPAAASYITASALVKYEAAISGHDSGNTVDNILREIERDAERLRNAAAGLAVSRNFAQAVKSGDRLWLDLNLKPENSNGLYDGITIVAPGGKKRFEKGIVPSGVNSGIKFADSRLEYPSGMIKSGERRSDDAYVLAFSGETPLMTVDEIIPSDRYNQINGIIIMARVLDSDYLNLIGRRLDLDIEIIPDNRISHIKWTDYSASKTPIEILGCDEYFFKSSDPESSEIIIPLKGGGANPEYLNLRTSSRRDPGNPDIVHSGLHPFTLPILIMFYFMITFYLLYRHYRKVFRGIRTEIESTAGRNRIILPDLSSVGNDQIAIPRMVLEIFDSCDRRIGNIRRELHHYRRNKLPLLDLAYSETCDELLCTALGNLSDYGFTPAGMVVGLPLKSKQAVRTVMKTAMESRLPGLEDYVRGGRWRRRQFIESKSGSINFCDLPYDNRYKYMIVLTLGTSRGKSYQLMSFTNREPYSIPEPDEMLTGIAGLLMLRVIAHERYMNARNKALKQMESLRLSNRLVKGGNRNDLMTHFLLGCREEFGFSNCSIYRLDNSGKRLIKRAYAGEYRNEKDRESVGLESDDIIARAFTAARSFESQSDRGKDELAVPMKSRVRPDGIWGLFHAVLKRGGQLDSEHRYMLNHLIKNLTFRLFGLGDRSIPASEMESLLTSENEREIMRLQGRVELLENLSRLCNEIVRADTPESIFSALDDHIHDFIDCHAVYWMNIDRKQNHVTLIDLVDDFRKYEFADQDRIGEWLKTVDRISGIYEFFLPDSDSSADPLNALFSGKGIKYLAAFPIPGAINTGHMIILGKRINESLKPSELQIMNRIIPYLYFRIGEIARGGARNESAETGPAIDSELARMHRITALGEMAGGVVHDFNNILASILGRVQLMLMRLRSGTDPRGDELIKNLELVEKMSMDGSRILKRIHEFTRKSGEESSEIIAVDQIIKDALDITRARCRDIPVAQGISIKVEPEFRPNHFSRANASEIREVLTNIIINAVEAMPDGGTIKIRNYADDNFNFIDVIDTGTGMDRETIDHIFDPFYTTKGRKGTGLGMSVSYDIVNRYGGGIRVESEPGMGSTITVSLPGVEKREDEECSNILEIESSSPSNILIIDDEDYIRDVLEELLISKGHRVHSASSGEEGIRKFESGNYDVVITDLGMPGVSGWEVAREIKKLSPRTRVVLATGWGAHYHGEDYRSKGVDLMVSKPFDMQAILGVVGNAAGI